MSLNRYCFSDPYIVEELTRAYKRADAKGRIELLSKFCNREQDKRGSPGLPYEVALMAVEDANVEVREYIARFGRYLEYCDSQWVNDRLIVEYPERNLAERLKIDADPFVRACLRENPTVFGGGVGRTHKWKQQFSDSTHLERLALVRNPVVDIELIEKIFDHEDQELGLTFEERKQLVAAFLTNESAVSRSYDTSREYRGEYIYADSDHFSKLWRLISKWPIQTTDNVASAVYLGLGAPDKTKAEIYKTCTPEDFRWEILENCSPEDVETLKLGAEDSDEYRREYAVSILQKGEQKKNTGGYALFRSPVNEGKSLSEKLDAIGMTLLDLQQELLNWPRLIRNILVTVALVYLLIVLIRKLGILNS